MKLIAIKEVDGTVHTLNVDAIVEFTVDSNSDSADPKGYIELVNGRRIHLRVNTINEIVQTLKKEEE